MAFVLTLCAMRLLLTCAITSALIAAEPVPFLEFAAAAAPSPPPVVAAWWYEACDGATDWVRAHAPGADLTTSARSVTALRLAAGGDVRGPGRSLRPVVAGWVEPASAVDTVLPLAPVFAPQALSISADGSRATLAGAGWQADPGQPQPGIRVVLHGAGLLAEVTSYEANNPLGHSSRLEPTAQAAVQAWRLTAGVEPDGRGWADLGLPSRWLAPVNPGVATLLPANAELSTKPVPVHGLPG